jgi:hypothetical protein
VGEFTLGGRDRWHNFGRSYGQYLTYINGTNIMLHSPLYSITSNDSLDVPSYNIIGTNASEGCLRTTAACAYFVYTKCAAGTRIKIVNGAPKGTGSPRPAPLADGTRYDPTDPFAPGGLDDTAMRPVSLSLDKTSATLNEGESINLTATVNPSGADTDTALTWNSSNPGAVSVTRNDDRGAVVKAVAASSGNLTITVTVSTANGKTAAFTVTVNAKAPPSSSKTVTSSAPSTGTDTSVSEPPVSSSCLRFRNLRRRYRFFAGQYN